MLSVLCNQETVRSLVDNRAGRVGLCPCVCVRACVRDPNETLSEFCAISHVRKYDDVISVTEAVNIIVAVSCLLGRGRGLKGEEEYGAILFLAC